MAPSGTGMPPPISPVARPMLTVRTTGFWKANLQPSRSSSSGWASSRPCDLAAARSSLDRAGSGNVKIRKAATRKVSELA